MKDWRLTAGLALAGGAALFPYHYATLQASGAGSPLWLAVLALAVTFPCFAIVAAQVRVFLVGRAPPMAMAVAALAALLVAAELPFKQVGLAALFGLALVQAFLVVLFGAAAFVLISAAKRPDAKTLWTAAALWLGVTAFAAIWFLRSHFIWYWDYSIYAILSRDLSEALRETGFLQGGVGVVENSLKFEYNMVAAVPMALVETVFGRTDRILHVLAVAFFYIGPTLLAGGALLRRCAPGAVGGATALVIVVLSSAVFPAALFSPLYGMPDIGGVGLIATLLVVAWRQDRSPQDAPGAIAPMILCGGLLFLLCLFRRWYVFATPALVVILAGHEFRRMDDRLAAGERLFATFKAMALLGAFAALCGFAFYWDRLIEMANHNYAGAYRAYANPAAYEIANALRLFGYGPLALYLAAAAWLTAHRTTRLAGLTAILAPASIAALFECVQGFDIHHYLLLIPSTIFALALASAHLIATRRFPRGAVLAALSAWAAVSIFGVATPGTKTFLQQAQIIPTLDMTPPQRDDLAEVNRLTHDLALHSDRGEKICVVASSPVMNRSVIRENALVLGPETQSLYGKNYIWLGDVDRRDGPTPEMENCDYAVLTTPLQLHLAIEEQQAIAFLDSAIKSGAGMGAAFRSTGQVYRLTGGVEAQVYRRIAPISPEDLRAYFGAVTKKPASSS